MIMPDVNVIVGAMRQDDPRHAMLSQWLASAVTSDEEVGMSVFVLGGVVRVMSSLRFFNVPTQVKEVLSELDRLLAHRNVTTVVPGDQHWRIFAHLCLTTGMEGSRLSDLQHAAVAIEKKATWVSLDKGFARIPGLAWEMPTAM